MASIKKYFRNALIGLASMILASLSVHNNPQLQNLDKNDVDDDQDLHMFI
jgi:hypothetical protein